MEGKDDRLLLQNLHYPYCMHYYYNNPQKGGRLLIRVPQMEGEQWEKLQLLFSIFEGETPLLVRAADTGRLLKAGEEYNTDANPVLLGELRRVLGQENVALLPPEAPKAPPEPALQ